MIRTQIALPEKEYWWLKRAAKSRGVSMASIVRDLLRREAGAVPDPHRHHINNPSVVEDYLRGDESL